MPPLRGGCRRSRLGEFSGDRPALPDGTEYSPLPFQGIPPLGGGWGEGARGAAETKRGPPEDLRALVWPSLALHHRTTAPQHHTCAKVTSGYCLNAEAQRGLGGSEVLEAVPTGHWPSLNRFIA